MTALTEKEKLEFFTRWTLLSFGIIPVSYMVSLIVVLLVHGAFGYNQTEGGTYLSQTVMQVAGGAVIGLGTGLLTGFLQWPVLRKHFLKSILWVPASTLGWGICILVPFFSGMVLKGGLSILTFIFGALLYGLITGGTLMWVLKDRVR